MIGELIQKLHDMCFTHDVEYLLRHVPGGSFRIMLTTSDKEMIFDGHDVQLERLVNTCDLRIRGEHVPEEAPVVKEEPTVGETTPPPAYIGIEPKEESKLFIMLQEIVIEQLGVNKDQATMQADFTEDLAADSLDRVELVMALEEETGVEFPDEVVENWNTIEDAFNWIYQLNKEYSKLAFVKV